MEYVKYSGGVTWPRVFLWYALAMPGVSHPLAIVHKKTDLILDKLRDCIA